MSDSSAAQPTNAVPLEKAKAPLGPGRISGVGVVLALVTIAIGVVGLRDGLISADLLHGGSLIESTVARLDGLKPQWWAVPGGVVAVLLGLWLLLTAVRPRPRTGVAVTSQTGVFLRPRDVRALAARAADEIDGVLTANVSTTRRKAAMNVRVTGNDGRIADEVRDAVAERLATLDKPPRVKVNLKAGGAP